jgi:protein phosphatase
MFEQHRPHPGRESVLKKISCRQITAVETDDPDVYALSQVGMESVGISVFDESGKVRVYAKMLDTSESTPQQIPKGHAALIPLDASEAFSIGLGSKNSPSSVQLQVDTASMTVTFGQKHYAMSADKPILMGRKKGTMWKDGVPTGIQLPEYTSKLGVSRHHATMGIINVNAKPHILIEDMSTNGVFIQFPERKAPEKQERRNRNVFLSDPELGLPAIGAFFRKYIAGLGKGDGLFDSNPGHPVSNPGMRMDSTPGTPAKGKEKSRNYPHIAAVTHASRFHAQNEDAYKVNLKTNTAILADGMGGHILGNVASETAVKRANTIISEITDDHTPEQVKEILKRAVREADASVVAKTKGGGTTLDIAKIIKTETGRTLVYAHSGDSRIVIKRGLDLIPVTQDHGMLWSDYNSGYITKERYHEIIRLLDTVDDPTTLDEQSRRYFNFRNVMGSCLGLGSVTVDADIIELQEGDQVIMYSDGVSDSLTELRIALGLNRSEIPSVQAQMLMNDVLEFAYKKKNMFIAGEQEHARGKPDDITIIVME